MLGSVSPNQKKTNQKNLAAKGVPTDITGDEFKKFFDPNKITHAKVERLKSKKDGRVLPMFRLEINDPTEAEALISQNLVWQVTGILYEVEEFRSPVSVKQCYNCQSFGHSAKTCRSKQKCLICGENLACEQLRGGERKGKKEDRRKKTKKSSFSSHFFKNITKPPGRSRARENHSHRGCPNREARKPKCANC